MTAMGDARIASWSSPIVWRPIHDADLAAIVAIEVESHAAPWTPGNFRDALAAGYGAVLGESAATIVAYGVWMFAPGEAQLLNLTVLDVARRQGLARTLLRRFLADAAQRGAQQAFLEVRVSNAAALALYAAEGFMSVARRAGYYPARPLDGVREDALVLRRSL
jgi:ribosomal-protein-alanine acetyltransferase